MVEGRRAGRVGIVGERHDADHVVGPAGDEAGERPLGRSQPGELRVAVGEVGGLHARALVERDDDRHPLARDPRPPADRLRPRQRERPCRRSPATAAASAATPAARPSPGALRRTARAWARRAGAGTVPRATAGVPAAAGPASRARPIGSGSVPKASVSKKVGAIARQMSTIRHGGSSSKPTERSSRRRAAPGGSAMKERVMDLVPGLIGAVMGGVFGYFIYKLGLQQGLKAGVVPGALRRSRRRAAVEPVVRDPRDTLRPRGSTAAPASSSSGISRRSGTMTVSAFSCPT